MSKYKNQIFADRKAWLGSDNTLKQAHYYIKNNEIQFMHFQDLNQYIVDVVFKHFWISDRPISKLFQNKPEHDQRFKWFLDIWVIQSDVIRTIIWVG